MGVRGEWRKNQSSKRDRISGLRGFRGLRSPSAKSQLPFELMAAEDFAGAGALVAVCGGVNFTGVEARAVCNLGGLAWVFAGAGLMKAGCRSGPGMVLSMSG